MSFFYATGPLRAFVLPSASQVRERYAQAMAFMRQQASTDSTRHRLCHSVSIGPPSAEVDGQISLRNADLGERPLNDKCPTKVARNQPTKQVKENVTEGTNTHCVDSSSHADSVGRHRPITLAAGGRRAGAGRAGTARQLGPPDRGAGALVRPALVQRSQECKPLIGWPVAPFCLLCQRSSRLMFTRTNKGVSTELCVAR